MKINKSDKSKLLGILIIFIFLGINLSTINNYGVTWDFTYHLNAGLWHLKLPLTDPNFIMGPSPPLSDIIPAIFYQIFHIQLNSLPFDVAYNLYGLIIGTMGIGILYFFIRDLINWRIGLFASLILGLLPRYFGHLHNNMKDIPQAVFFTLSIWLFWRLFQRPNISNLIFASISFAIAFNSKVNAVFVLLIAFSFLITIRMLKRVQHDRKHIITLLYFILSPFFAFILWLPFWDHPIARLIEASHSYTTSTTNMPLLYFGKIVYSGNNVPWHYPLGILAATTPILVLIFTVIGLVVLSKNKKIPFESKLLILLWLFIPLLRYLKPHMIVIDDIRHFMEVIFPFAVVSGIGMYGAFTIIVRISNKIIPRINKEYISFCYLLFVICYLLFQIYTYHPYQTSYYNELIGGIKGASGKFDIEFWASAYKNGLKYINANASINAKIIIPMAPDIAKLYLRKDLITNLNTHNLAGTDSRIYTQSDYTVILNRESFFRWYGIYPYIQNHQPIYILKLLGVPLVSIYKN